MSSGKNKFSERQVQLDTSELMKRKPKNPVSSQYKKELDEMLSEEGRHQFEYFFTQMRTYQTKNGKPIPITPIDRNLFEDKKSKRGLTNLDIVNFFNNCFGKCMSTGTLQSKLNARNDFTVSEVLTISYLLGLSIDEMLEMFQMKI